jgi:homotetrameric cytidine deaminase
VKKRFDTLRAYALSVADRAYVPYSGHPAAAVLLLSDGIRVPGVRVESASFSLVIPALVNAVTTAVAIGRTDIIAAVLNRAVLPEEAVYMTALPGGPLNQVGVDAFQAPGVETLPTIGEECTPFLQSPPPTDPNDGIIRARQAAQHAYVPASDFPVGCIFVAGDGRIIPGVNVEHPDWGRTLCAERNALGTALTWGVHDLHALYLTCLKDPAGSPCGACRQLLAELAPEATVWMDRNNGPPEKALPPQLLPGAFHGRALVRPA